MEYVEQPEEGLIKEAREYIELSSRYLLTEEAASHYSTGQKVVHKIFGTGTIVDVDMDKSAYTILFDGMETPRTISFRVKLECI